MILLIFVTLYKKKVTFKKMKKMNRILVFVLFVSVSLSVQAQDNPPKDWWLMSPADGYNGVQSYKTYDELLKDKPSRTVIVAVIDSGIDVEHEDLKDNIWVNPGEIAGNGIDDDNNGYIDDIHGWNFIGGPNGKNVGPDTYEATRVYGKLKYKYENANPEKLNKSQKEEYELYLKVKENVENSIEGANKNLSQITAIEERILGNLKDVDMMLQEKGMTLADIDSLDSENESVAMISNVMRQVSADGNGYATTAAFKTDLQEALAGDKKRFEDQLEYAYNVDFDPRKTIVMDNYEDQTEKYYGNNDVEGPDASHGTHVAGIIGAMTGNEYGIEGVARNVKIMSVRAVPDGDERDKDVANAIRYAVDNGASIINMSFGKGFSWNEEIVEDAIKYAAKNDVLLVHAAGNSAQDNDVTDNFPNDSVEKRYWLFWKKKKPAKNWLEIGALSYKQEEDLVATFSNYGKENVDLFSPGVKIYSTIPGDGYASFQGTSMASPAAAGVAAVLRSYFPSLTAEQTKEILMASGTKLADKVKVPGTKGEKVAGFGELSVSGNTVNMYEAVRMAMNTKGKKKVNMNKGA